MDKELMDFTLTLRKRYTAFSEIFDLTKQLQEVISRNDTRSVKMIMRDRTRAMKEAEGINLQLEKIKKELSKEHLAIVEEQCSVEFAPETLNQQEHMIHTIYMGTRKVIEKTIELNKMLQQKFTSSVKGKQVVK
ncbi:MAG: hypothetical protein R3Y53_04945 [Bacillota bacterium]